MSLCFINRHISVSQWENRSAQKWREQRKVGKIKKDISNQIHVQRDATLCHETLLGPFQIHGCQWEVIQWQESYSLNGGAEWQPALETITLRANKAPAWCFQANLLALLLLLLSFTWRQIEKQWSRTSRIQKFFTEFTLFFSLSSTFKSILVVFSHALLFYYYTSRTSADDVCK